MLSVVFTHTRKLQNNNTKLLLLCGRIDVVVVFNARRQECFCVFVKKPEFRGLFRKFIGCFGVLKDRLQSEINSERCFLCCWTKSWLLTRLQSRFIDECQRIIMSFVSLFEFLHLLLSETVRRRRRYRHIQSSDISEVQLTHHHPLKVLILRRLGVKQ